MTVLTAIVGIARYSRIAIGGAWRAARLLVRLFVTIVDEAPLPVLLVLLVLIIVGE